MKPKLRTYQRKAVRAVLSAVKEGGSPILVAPTGSGKTVMGAEIVKRCKGPVLWVAHRRELLQQAVEHLTAAGCDAGLYAPGVSYPVEAASALSALRSKRKYATIVIDECHRAASLTYKHLLENSPSAAVIGLTATPWRLDNKPLRETFSALVTAASMPELIEAGYVAAPLVFGVSEDKARDLVQGVGSEGVDYSIKELSEAMVRPRILGDVVNERERLGGDRKTLVFAVSATHAEKLAKRFRAKGRTAAALGHHVSKHKREVLLQSFRNGDLQIVVNVDLLAEGFDMAAIQCVSMARPTRSLTRYLQYVGRALRPYGEEAPVVLDHVGNTWRHGLPEAHREWSLEAQERRYNPLSDRAYVWRCLSCGQMLDLGVAACPHCGFDRKSALMREERKLRLERVNSPLPPCLQCGNPCRRRKAGRPDSKFCGDRCRKDHRRSLSVFTCQYCGKAKHSSPSNKRKFCDSKCYAGSRRTTPVNTRACKACGRRPLKGKQQYCDWECRRLGARGPRLPPKVCPVCGGAVSRKSSRTRCCSIACSRKLGTKK